MTEAVDTATTTASGAESSASEATTTEQQQAATDQGQQQAAQQQDESTQATAVPEKYEFAAPEGYQLDAAATEKWSGVFKDLGLTQEQAQKLVDMDAERTAGGAKAAQEAHQRQIGEWVESIKQDKELGGAKFEENISIAQRALADFGTPDLKQMLEDSGLGSHPEVVRFFHKVGRELGEGKLHRSTSEVPQERSLAERLYPNYSK